MSDLSGWAHWAILQQRGGFDMSTTKTKREIEHLKDELKSTYRKQDFRLLKMTVFMVILAVIAAVMYGKIQIW